MMERARKGLRGVAARAGGRALAVALLMVLLADGSRAGAVLRAAGMTMTPETTEVMVTGVVVVTDDGPLLETVDDRIFLLRGVTDLEMDGLEVVVTGIANQIEDGYFTLDVTGYSVVDEDNGESATQASHLEVPGATRPGQSDVEPAPGRCFSMRTFARWRGQHACHEEVCPLSYSKVMTGEG